MWFLSRSESKRRFDEVREGLVLCTSWGSGKWVSGARRRRRCVVNRESRPASRSERSGASQGGRSEGGRGEFESGPHKC